MKNKDFISIPELARILGISRIAVYKQVKSGKIKGIKAGKNFIIPTQNLSSILGETLGEEGKSEIEKAVKKTVKEYGETLKLLGKD
jgi:excisionase family DNA binding protein